MAYEDRIAEHARRREKALAMGSPRHLEEKKAAGFYAQEVIDPRETRAYLKRLLEIYQMRPSGGIGEHRLRYWPTSI